MIKNFMSFKHFSTIFTLILMIISTAIAFILFYFLKSSSINVALIYILALTLTARYTRGYWYGIFFSIFSVICVNFLFTHPFFTLNFTLSGYPITFLIMLTITLMTSATTSHFKIENESTAVKDEILSKAEKEKMRANLLRAISHDLRTPLTSIIGESNAYFETVGKNCIDEKDRLVHQINDDANWLLNMVENLLSVTRIKETGNAKVNKSNEIVEEIVSESILRFKKRQPNAIVKATIPENYIILPMDPLLIEQVIINLLENAFVHSASKREINLIITEDSPNSVSFHIRDYGIGIDPEMIDTIFDGISARNFGMPDAHRGMGIGLSICKTIIEAHDGTIKACNHIDGAEFIFTLPRENEHGNKI